MIKVGRTRVRFYQSADPPVSAPPCNAQVLGNHGAVSAALQATTWQVKTQQAVAAAPAAAAAVAMLTLVALLGPFSTLKQPEGYL